MSGRRFATLFLCTGNSARSILSESLLRHWGGARFRAYSAGSHPSGAVHPLALAVLDRAGLPTEGLRSKSWEEFARPGAPALDFIITVCNDAAGEVCPVWPGRPATAHWGVPDPAAATGSAARRLRAMTDVFETLQARVRRLSLMDTRELEGPDIRRRLQEIGTLTAADAPAWSPAE